MFCGLCMLLYAAIRTNTKTVLENSTISVQMVHRTEDGKIKNVKFPHKKRLLFT